MVMINLGVKDDNFESFISEDLGVSQENIATHMKDLVGFSKTVPVPLSEVPGYFKQKTHAKEKLELR
jgi:hypothetical protein